MGESLDGNTAGIALPDDIHVAHREWNGLATPDAHPDIGEHAISQIDRVVEPNDGDRRAITLGVELEHAFTAKRRDRVLSHRADLIALPCAPVRNRRERINIAGGEGDDTCGAISLD